MQVFVRYCEQCTQTIRCWQVTKTHVIDFDQSRVWILYSERRSYVNLHYRKGFLNPHLVFSGDVKGSNQRIISFLCVSIVISN